MPELQSYVRGAFQGGGAAVELLNPATEEVVAVARCGGVDQEAALEFARARGVPALRRLGFAGRGELLGKMAALVHEHRDELIETSVQNGGSTRGGAKFDVDGAAGTLAAYAELAATLGDADALADGEVLGLGRGARLGGRHWYVGREGVAVLINAFNFPAWGFAEKAAQALLAGMPVIVKPATLTCWTAVRLAEVLVAGGILPEGALSLLLGPVDGVLNGLNFQDCVAFTGSSSTGMHVRSLENLLRHSVAVNVEADSLNAAVLGPDVEPGSPCFQVFVRDVLREMTEKTGQKCTAVRRAFVPEPLVEPVVEELWARLSGLKVGNPDLREVEMGPLATAQQVRDVHAGIDRLRAHADQALGQNRPDHLAGVPAGKGFFAGPNLFVARSERAVEEVHRDEVFGPVATVLPCDGTVEAAVAGVRRGQGMLVTSVYSDDRDFLQRVASGSAPFCGRVVLVDSRSEGFTLPTGMVLPQLVHGGPGRAGGGEELGGVRGIQHYLRRVAFQGPRGLISDPGKNP